MPSDSSGAAGSAGTAPTSATSQSAPAQPSYYAVANGPITFFESATGQQKSIALSDLSFSLGVLTPKSGVPSEFVPWLKYLATVGVITPGSVVTPASGTTIAAAGTIVSGGTVASGGTVVGGGTIVSGGTLAAVP